MKSVSAPFKVTVQILLAGLFCASLIFWISVVFYCVHGFITGGVPGVENWLMHIAARSSETSALPEVPEWSVIALRLGGLAVITFLLWLANRRLLARLRQELHLAKARSAAPSNTIR